MKKLLSKVYSVLFTTTCKVFYKRIVLGKNNRLTKSTEIIATKGSKIILGDNCTCEKNVLLKSSNQGHISIGDNVYFNRGTSIYSLGNVIVGNDTIFGPNCLVFDHDHSIIDGKIQKNDFSITDVTIGNNVWIGAGTLILRGSVIGDNCIIGAGSIIKGQIPKDTIVIQKRDKTVFKRIQEQ